MADLGSRGPWLMVNEFQLDFQSYSWIFTRYAFSVDSVASFRNRMCEKYFSAGFKFGAAGMYFDAQKLDLGDLYWVG